MKHPPRNGPKAALSRGLSACILGLLLTPLAYIGMGALSGFAPAFALVSLPPLLASGAFLLSRLLARPNGAPARGWRVFAELVSWLVVLGFVAVVSGFTLLTSLERIGLAATCFLVASVVSLPVPFLRDTALERRFDAWSTPRASVVLILVLASALTAALAYLLAPPAFV